MSIRKYQAYPENARGPFYVVDDECIMCGAPESVAPDLIAFHEEGNRSHCFFKKQPETPEEIDRAVMAVGANCCGSYRYAGSDDLVKEKLKSVRRGDAIDS